jgi:hypothetical protein
VGCLLALAALVMSGCSASASAPAATPADFEGVVAELDRGHVAVDHVVSGDAGCDDRSLAPAAIAFDARGLDQPTPVRIHLFLFRDGATYDRLRPAVDRCAAAFVADPQSYVALDARPFVAVSPGPWAPQFTAAVRSAVTRAAGG